MEISKITATIEQFRQLSQVNVQAGWQAYLGNLPPQAATTAATWANWKSLPLNTRNHIAWPKGSQVLWLGQRLLVPPALQGYPVSGLMLRLGLTWWSEFTQVYVNGQLVQEGDLFDSSTRILLSRGVSAGECFDVALRLVSPGHDDGALVRSQCLYESPTGIDPGFVADELTVLFQYLQTCAPEQLPQFSDILSNLSLARVGDRAEFLQALQNLRQTLIQANWNIGENGKLPNLALLGHAHLDLAWLWPVAETWDAALRTFNSVIKLQKEFPKLTFCHSTPALYDWIEQHRPDLFQTIQNLIQAGNWEVVGGLWVEPELNTLSGESLARQVLYGQHYCLTKFGQASKIAWLPDSFGFCWQLPQILKLGQIEYFVTQKLRWNDTTQFPYQVFWWRSPEGSQILSLMSAPIGEGIDPVKMGNYAVEWQNQTQLKDALWLFGVGDRGGGPTRDMLEIAQRWQTSPFFPKTQFATAEQYLETLTKTPLEFPIWQDELYLEFHRGCYTSHADQKQFNRNCEQALYQAELWSSIATLILGQAYPKSAIEQAWKTVLFNQFHDILPGSAILEVYQEANPQWQAALTAAHQILEQALSAIASSISASEPPHPQAQPLVIFNSLNWRRSEVVALSITESAITQIYDSNGQKCATQLLGEKCLLFAENIPAIGYQLFWVSFGDRPHLPIHPNTEYILENQFISVQIDPNTGEITQIFDKQQQREILKGAGNQLQFFQDSEQYWDAWNINPNYEEYSLPSAELKSIQWLAKGEIYQSIRVILQFENSEFIQDYILESHSPILKIATQVNWQEEHILVKAAFPLNLEADFVTCEMPFGAIQRTTHPQTPAETAKWEVPLLNWVDITDNSQTFGVSLLNDGKYGCDLQCDRLRLTLLRSPRWPDPECDRGYHQFTYAIYPHAGSWETAETVRRGYELNCPLQAQSLPRLTSPSNPPLPPIHQFLEVGADNLVLTAFKLSETDANRWILRCYECQGQPSVLQLQTSLPLVGIQAVDLLEQPLTSQAHNQVKPWQIATWALQAEGLSLP